MRIHSLLEAKRIHWLDIPVPCEYNDLRVADSHCFMRFLRFMMSFVFGALLFPCRDSLNRKMKVCAQHLFDSFVSMDRL